MTDDWGSYSASTGVLEDIPYAADLSLPGGAGQPSFARRDIMPAELQARQLMPMSSSSAPSR